jgi:hypothetical protein
VTHLNASLLGGKSAAALETSAKIFTLNPNSGPLTQFTADLPGLKHGGLYQISYAVDVLSTGNLLCFIQQGAGPAYDLLGYGTTQGGYTTDSVTGVARVPSTADLELYCSGDAIQILDSPSDDKTEVVATPIDAASNTRVTAVAP